MGLPRGHLRGALHCHVRLPRQTDRLYGNFAQLFLHLAAHIVVLDVVAIAMDPIEQAVLVAGAGSTAAGAMFTAAAGFILVAGIAALEEESSHVVDDQEEVDWAIRQLELRRQEAADRALAMQLEALPRHQIILPYIQNLSWQLTDWEDEWIVQRVRFTRQEIYEILPYLRLDLIQWTNKYNPSPEKALCILLCRLAWPGRLKDLIQHFGCSGSQLSSIFNDVADHLFHYFRKKLFFDEARLTPQKMLDYAQIINQCGGGDEVWGWIDGTVTRTCRPGENQRLMYNSHKHYHGFKFQAVMTPDGIISSLAGPMVGSRNDWYMFQDSQLEEEIVAMWNRHQTPINDRVFIFGDPAYTGSRVTRGAYRRPRHGHLDPFEALFNYDMSQNRISVEHGFALISNTWSKMNLFNTLRIGSSPVASYFGAAVLLTNVWTILRGNQVSQRYGAHPPTLEEYFGRR